MLSYILFTYLLLFLGGGLYYFLIRNSQLPFQHQRLMLLSIMGMSLVLPFITKYHLLPEIVHTEPVQSSMVLMEEVYSEFCPSDAEINTCYEEALTAAEFCECTEIAKENIVAYKADWTYELVIVNETWFLKGCLLAALLIFMILMAKILYLVYIVRISRREQMELEGIRFVALRNDKQLSVASFQLLDKYVIWQNEMDFLQEQELKAVLWHEVAHIQQKDTWVKILVESLQALWFLNPAFYFFKRELDKLAEFIADEYAVVRNGSSKFYANVLINMKRYQSIALAQHLKKSLFRERIELIIGEPKKKKPLRIIPAMIMISCCLIWTSTVGFPILENQLLKVEFYETLSKASADKHRHLFCKNCKNWE